MGGPKLLEPAVIESVFRMDRSTMSLIESLMRRIEPRLDPEVSGRLVSVADGVWQIERQVAFPFGMRMPLRATLLAMGDGSLMVHSPVELGDELHEEIASLGSVGAIVAPNTFHHTFVGGWVERYPEAEFFASPGLEAREVEIPRSTELTDEPSEMWRETVDQQAIRGGEMFSEVVFFHRPSGSLVLTDLAFNGPPGESWWERVAWRIFGIPSGFGASRNIRWSFLRKVDDLEGRLRQVLEWPFERVCVAHGPPLEEEPRRTFAAAFGLDEVPRLEGEG
jgi:hypothetical protein